MKIPLLYLFWAIGLSCLCLKADIIGNANLLITDHKTGPFSRTYELLVEPDSENPAKTDILFTEFRLEPGERLVVNNLAPGLSEELVDGYLVVGNPALSERTLESISLDLVPEALKNVLLAGGVIVAGDTAKLDFLASSDIEINGLVLSKVNSVLFENNYQTQVIIGEKGLCSENNIHISTECLVVKGAIKSIDRVGNLTPAALLVQVADRCLFEGDSQVLLGGVFVGYCGKGFENRGFWELEGSFTLDADYFINEGLWSWGDWSAEFLAEVEARCCVMDGRCNHGGYNRGGYWIDYWQYTPWDDFYGRKEEFRKKDTGILRAHGMLMSLGTRGASNRFGGEILDYGFLNNASSSVIAQGDIWNQFKKRHNEDGFHKSGFAFYPSTWMHHKDVLLHSLEGTIINEASDMSIGGNLTLEAGKNIELKAVEENFIMAYSMKPHARWKKHRRHFLPFDNYKASCAPYGKPGNQNMCGTTATIKHFEAYNGNAVQHRMHLAPKLLVGGDSVWTSAEDILQKGSITLVEGDLTMNAGNNYELIVNKISQAHARDIIQQVLALREKTHGNEAHNSLGILYLENTLAEAGEPQWTYEANGIQYAGGKILLTTGSDVTIEGGTLASGDTVKITTEQGDIYIKGVMESYIAESIRQKDLEIDRHGFTTKHGAILGENGVSLEAYVGAIRLNGAVVGSAGDIHTTAQKGIYGTAHTQTAEDRISITKRKPWTGKKDVITTRSSTSATLSSGFYADGEIYLNAPEIIFEGTHLNSNEKVHIEADTLTLRGHKVPRYTITDVKSRRLTFPGIAQVGPDLANGEYSKHSLVDNVPALAAFDKLIQSKSLGDMCPKINAAMAFLQMGEDFTDGYISSSGSILSGLSTATLNQLGLQRVGGIILPKGIGIVHGRSHHEVHSEDHFPSTVKAPEINITARNMHIKGSDIEGERVYLEGKEEFLIDADTIHSKSSWSQKSHDEGLTITQKHIGISGGFGRGSGWNKDTHHIFSKILASEKLTIQVGDYMEVNGAEVLGKELELKVSGKLLVKTPQDTRLGAWSQEYFGGSLNIGYDGIPIPGVTVDHAEGKHAGSWAHQITRLGGELVHVVADKLTLIGSLITGSAGTVKAPEMEWEDLQNYYTSTGKQYGFTTQLLPGEDNRGRILQGMPSLGGSDEERRELLRATIEAGIGIESESDLEGLNRELQKARQSLGGGKVVYSFGVPIMDFKALGEKLGKMGWTARDIARRAREAFAKSYEALDREVAHKNFAALEAKKECNYERLGAFALVATSCTELKEAERKSKEAEHGYQKLNELFTLFNELQAKIEKSQLTEGEKIELISRLLFAFTNTVKEHPNGPKRTHFIAFEGYGTNAKENQRLSDRIYRTERGVVYVDEHAGVLNLESEEEHLGLFKELLGAANAETFRRFQKESAKRELSFIERICGSYPTTHWHNEAVEILKTQARGMSYGFVTAPIELLETAQYVYQELAQFVVELTDGSLLKDLGTLAHLSGEEVWEILSEVGRDFGEVFLEGMRQSLTSPEGHGALVADALITKFLGTAAKVGKVGRVVKQPATTTRRTGYKGGKEYFVDIGNGKRLNAAEAIEQLKPEVQKQLEGMKIPDKALVPDGGLIGHELRGCHTIERHVGKSKDYLLERYQAALANKYKKMPEGFSTFVDLEQAEHFVAKTLKANKAEIDTWLKTGNGEPLVVRSRFNEVTGPFLKVPEQKIIEARGVRVVLNPDKNARSYVIKTAFPEIVKE